MPLLRSAALRPVSVAVVIAACAASPAAAEHCSKTTLTAVDPSSFPVVNLSLTLTWEEACGVVHKMRKTQPDLKWSVSVVEEGEERPAEVVKETGAGNEDFVVVRYPSGLKAPKTTAAVVRFDINGLHNRSGDEFFLDLAGPPPSVSLPAWQCKRRALKAAAVDDDRGRLLVHESGYGCAHCAAPLDDQGLCFIRLVEADLNGRPLKGHPIVDAKTHATVGRDAMKQARGRAWTALEQRLKPRYRFGDQAIARVEPALDKGTWRWSLPQEHGTVALKLTYDAYSGETWYRLTLTRGKATRLLDKGSLRVAGEGRPVVSDVFWSPGAKRAVVCFSAPTAPHCRAYTPPGH